LGSKDGAAERALAYHQYGQGLIPPQLECLSFKDPRENQLRLRWLRILSKFIIYFKETRVKHWLMLVH